MRAKLRMLLLPATLLLLATLVWADDPPSSSWFPNWFGNGKTAKKTTAPADDWPEEPDDAPAKKDAKGAPPKAGPAAYWYRFVGAGEKADKVQVTRAQAQAAYLRRTAVCLKLREIADATNDDALRQMVEQLETRIWQLYSRRTADVKVAMKE